MNKGLYKKKKKEKTTKTFHQIFQLRSTYRRAFAQKLGDLLNFTTKKRERIRINGSCINCNKLETPVE